MTRSFGVTHPGRKRQDNQDTFFASDEEGLWLLADGMGGNRGGEVASKLAQDTVVESLKQGVPVREAILNAHRAILDYGEAHEDLKGLGTTLVAVVERKDRTVIAWVGDSRIYLWRKNELSRLSKDHSVVQRLLDSGLINGQEAVNHPHSNLVTSCLGIVKNDGSELEIGELDFNWRSGDKLLLCSDGLTDELDDERLRQIMLESSNSQSQIDQMLKDALDAGGRDNTTMLMVESPVKRNLVQRFFNRVKV